MNAVYAIPAELVLGERLNVSVPDADQKRQRQEVAEILNRLRSQPGVVIGDEVGMGKTFVALAVAYSLATRSSRGPVIVMVPANLVDKWVQDLSTFCELYVRQRHPVVRGGSASLGPGESQPFVFGIARHSIELMKLLDDPPKARCRLIFLAQGAMSRTQSDRWVRLALIAEAFRLHGRGRAARLIQVKQQAHRFLGELLYAKGQERAHELGAELWQRLLKADPGAWKDILSPAISAGGEKIEDDPVPKSVVRALARVDLRPLAKAMETMPIRATGGDERVTERLNDVRQALREVESGLWKELLARARWRSPLLVMDEAHHLKNPGTSLARQLQSPDTAEDLRTGDGAMSKAFERMLFLTATPFQLGHHELVRILERFGDVRWDEAELGSRDGFLKCLEELEQLLTESQRTAIGFQRSWCGLQPEPADSNIDVGGWWSRIVNAPPEGLPSRQRAVVEAFGAARRAREAAELALRPWIIRHNKGSHWAATTIERRRRLDGRAISEVEGGGGLSVPKEQMLAFFLAARSSSYAAKDLLGDALCSSYEAFRLTRKQGAASRDEVEDDSETEQDLSHSRWYLDEFDRALGGVSGSCHPKLAATVRKVADLWEAGEKVVVFAFYRQTCRALRLHISAELEKRIHSTVLRRLPTTEQIPVRDDTERLLERVQRRFFDDADSPGRGAVDQALSTILGSHRAWLDSAGVDMTQREAMIEIMRRFLRVTSTLARCFPVEELDSIEAEVAVARTLDSRDGSGMSWREKFDGFLEFLTRRCAGNQQRADYLEALQRTQTGSIRVAQEDEEPEDPEELGTSYSGTLTLANVQVATGKTKREARTRLMRAFNTPFFPDILVCSEVMGEGVDLHRFCRHVIHHDLAWNPSTIEQRTGRIDRLGCKAEGRHPIHVYLPHVAGTGDERQFRVMSDREQWFRVVMGQDEVARLITPESNTSIPLPTSVSEALSFRLGL